MSAQANLKILLLRIRTKKRKPKKNIQIFENLHTCYDCVSGKAVEVGVTMYVLSISSLSEVEMVLGPLFLKLYKFFQFKHLAKCFIVCAQFSQRLFFSLNNSTIWEPFIFGFFFLLNFYVILIKICVGYESIDPRRYKGNFNGRNV